MIRFICRSYYSIGPAELFFNGQNVVKGGLSFVLDSGSTYTYFSSHVYEAVLSMVRMTLLGILNALQLNVGNLIN